MDGVLVELSLSPERHVYLNRDMQSSEELSFREFAKIEELFAGGSATGLLYLGLSDFKVPLPPSFLFWQTFSREFITRLLRGRFCSRG